MDIVNYGGEFSMIQNKRLKPVPGTDASYLINVHGELWTKEGNYIPTEYTGEDVVVTIHCLRYFETSKTIGLIGS